LLTDFSYTNFTVTYRDALDRLRVHLNIILLLIYSQLILTISHISNSEKVIKITHLTAL